MFGSNRELRRSTLLIADQDENVELTRWSRGSRRSTLGIGDEDEIQYSKRPSLSRSSRGSRRSTLRMADYADMQEGYLLRVESLASIASRSPETNKCNFVISHEGRFKIIWDWIILILVIFTAIHIPFYNAFSVQTKVILQVEKLSDVEPMMVISVLVDCMFFLDIFINFRTTYLNSSSDEVVRDQKKLAIHYLKRWFIIDLLAAIPFDWIMHKKNSEGGSTSTLIGLLKSARLLRLFQVARKVDRYSEYGLAVLFLLMCLFTLISHWLACVWNAISIREEKHNLNSWVRRMDDTLNGKLNHTHYNGTIFIRLSTSQRYIASLYYIVSSLTSVGFGNVAASTEAEQIFSIVVMLIGALMYACIFGNMVAIIQRFYSKTSEFHSHMSKVREFLRFYKIPEELRNTVNNYVRREWAASQGVDVESVLRRFPDSIQADITYELYYRIFQNIPPFKSATVCVIRALSMKFKTMTLQANNYAIRQGEEINRLYILGKGSLDILINGDLVDLLAKYSIFGYDFVKVPKLPKSNANVRAACSVEIHFIHKDDMYDILRTYPKFAKKFRDTIKIGFDLNDENEEGSVKLTPKKEKIHITAIAKSALAMPIMARWTKTSQKMSTFDNGRKKASSDNDLNMQSHMNGDVAKQSVSIDSIPLKYKEACLPTLPKPIIKLQSQYANNSNAFSVNSINSVRFSTETIPEEDEASDVSSTQVCTSTSDRSVDHLQSQMRALSNEVHEFKDSLNGQLVNIMEMLQDLRNENVPQYELQGVKCTQQNSIEINIPNKRGKFIHSGTSDCYINIEDDEKFEKA